MLEMDTKGLKTMKASKISCRKRKIIDSDDEVEIERPDDIIIENEEKIMIENDENIIIEDDENEIVADSEEERQAATTRATTSTTQNTPISLSKSKLSFLKLLNILFSHNLNSNGVIYYRWILYCAFINYFNGLIIIPLIIESLKNKENFKMAK